MGLNYVEVAKCIAAASKDPRYKIGAIIFDEHGNIRSTGYNGVPRRVADSPRRYEKPLKQFYVTHAEANAIAQAARTGVSTNNCTMLVWGKTPCANCAQLIIQAGIVKVVFQEEDIRDSSYYQSFEASLQMFHEANIEVIHLEPQ